MSIPPEVFFSLMQSQPDTTATTPKTNTRNNSIFNAKNHRSGRSNHNKRHTGNGQHAQQQQPTPNRSRTPVASTSFATFGGGGGSSHRPRRESIGNEPPPTRSANRVPMPFSVKIEITKEMEAEIRQLNIKYLKTQDKDFRYLVESSTQAAIYRHTKEGWSDPDAAGCLMLYERNTSPRVGFIILNRFAVPHWKYAFTPKSLEIQVQGNYLLFKEGRQIFTLWFYQNGESEKFCEILQRFGAKLIDMDASQQLTHIISQLVISNENQANRGRGVNRN